MIAIPYALAHFIGDFCFQNDWMAIGKKKSSLICSIHVFFYMLPFLLVEVTPWQFVLIAVQHWLQDRTRFIRWWCRTIGSFQIELTKDSLPWGHFVVDQVFHFTWLWIVFNLITV